MSVDLQVPIRKNETMDSKLKPPIEFHKQKSLQVRLWQCIYHCWLAIALVELLFNHEHFYNWTVKQCFVFSVQIFAPCGASCYNFLDPLAGFCMRYTNQDEIEANRKNLQKIWEAPSTFMHCGNNFLREKPVGTRTKLIVACFMDLKQLLSRKSQYNRWLPFNTRLQMLRAYTFQFWLEQTANLNIKKMYFAQFHQKPHTTNPRQDQQPPIRIQGPPPSLCHHHQRDQEQRPVSME